MARKASHLRGVLSLHPVPSQLLIVHMPPHNPCGRSEAQTWPTWIPVEYTHEAVPSLRIQNYFPYRHK